MSKKKSKIQKMFYGKTEGENRTINLQFRVTEDELDNGNCQEGTEY